ncbi:MAG: hypothetical protein JO189_20630 [Deltaproteobacteria bacterium]|nr:hypothetical protein [Deltaproteobacteria bacterium]
MADRFESFGEAIKQSNEAYAAAISALSKAVQNLPTGAPRSDRERFVDNVLHLARISKNAVVTAIEQGFELWERQVRQVSAGGTEVTSSRPDTASRPGTAGSNPIEAWAENWRKATETFITGGGNEELRRQAEAVQNAFVEGIRAWQRLWEPERR